MSATTRPATDAPQGQGEDFDAVFAEMVAGQQPPEPDGATTPPEQPQPPETPDEGRTTPPRDERGRFAARPEQEQPATTTTPTEPAEGAPVDWEARWRDTEAAREKEANDRRAAEGRIEAERRRAEDLARQAAQGEQAWRERQERDLADQRRRQGEDLNQRLVAAMARGDITEQDAQTHRRLLTGEGSWAAEDLARKEAAWEQERQQLRQVIGGMHRDTALDKIPEAMRQYAPYMAQIATDLHGTQLGVQVSPEDAGAFLAQPEIQQAIRETLPLGRAALNAFSQQLAYPLAVRAQLGARQRELDAQREEWERQRQLTDNRAAAAGNGATRELVPGSAGPTDPDLARFQSRPGNEGDHFNELWAATRQEQ
jgi:hypothetical protein